MLSGWELLLSSSPSDEFFGESVIYVFNSYVVISFCDEHF